MSELSRDGLLAIVRETWERRDPVPQVGLHNAVPLLWRLFRGSLYRVATVRRWQGERFIIERERPGWIHTDGEPRAEISRLEITVRPRSLRIMVPAEK